MFLILLLFLQISLISCTSVLYNKIYTQGCIQTFFGHHYTILPEQFGRGIWWNLQYFLWPCQFSWNEWGDKCIWGKKSNNHKKGGLVITKLLRYLEVIIFKFCPVEHLILIFIRRILPLPELFENFPEGKSILKQMLFHNQYKVSIGFGGTVFLKKWCWRGMSECGDKKISGGGGESAMDDATGIPLS